MRENKFRGESTNASFRRHIKNGFGDLRCRTFNKRILIIIIIIVYYFNLGLSLSDWTPTLSRILIS